MSDQASSQECGFNTPAPVPAFDVEHIVVQTPYGQPALHLPASPPLPPPPSSPLPHPPSSPLPHPPSSPLSPALPCPPNHSFVPLSSSLSPNRIHSRVLWQLSLPFTHPPWKAAPKPRRQRGLKPYDRTVKIPSTKQVLLLCDIKDNRFMMEEKRLRLRLNFKEAQQKRLHDLDMEMLSIVRPKTHLQQTLADIKERISSFPN